MKHIATSALALCLALGLSACGEAVISTQDRVAEMAETPKETARSSSRKGVGDCDLFTAAELDAAFAGKLSFKAPSGYNARGNGCNVDINGYEGSFMLQAESKEAYEARKADYKSYEQQGSAKLVPVSIGAEGFLVNNGQVITIDAEGRALNVAIQLFVFDREPPITPEDGAAAVQAIAEKALGRL